MGTALAACCWAQGNSRVIMRLPELGNPLPGLPHAHRIWQQAGDRFDKPGRERAALTGSFADAQGRSSPAEIVLEHPGKVRIDTGAPGPGRASLVYDGAGSGKPGGGRPTDSELDVLEVLAHDLIDGFLQIRQIGGEVTFTGSGYRLQTGPNQFSPETYNVYTARLAMKVRGDPVIISKIYAFDPVRSVLARVRTGVVRNGRTVGAETIHEGWRAVQGQMLPSRTTYLVDGQRQFVLNIDGAAFAGKRPDNTFAR
jgi:hypothetical protein